MQNNADEVLKLIYNLPEWNGVGKGKECSYDSKELRSAIWQRIFPLISIENLPQVNELGSISDLERLNKTRTKGRYNDDDDMVSIESDECYTFYNDVNTIVNHFGTNYWKNKVNLKRKRAIIFIKKKKTTIFSLDRFYNVRFQ